MSSTEQICSKCSAAFYKGVGSVECIANPAGVQHCAVYSDLTTCQTCDLNYYLEANVCVLLENPIADCLIQSSVTECVQCGPKKLPNETKDACVDVVEQSCSEWADIDNCSKCEGNHVLKTNEDEKTVCVTSGLLNCLEAQYDSNPAACTLCRFGFILKEGKCIAPQVQIANCEVYNPETEKCDSCFNGFVLSAMKDSCLDRIIEAGSFCTKAHIPESEEPVCNLCNSGHYLDSENNCVQCGGEGCHICDLTNKNKCKLCAKGYYMANSETCSLNKPIVESQKIMGTISMILLLASILI
jgi:hypothetical protein